MKEAHGDSIRDSFLMDLGNPFTGKVEIRLEDGAEMPGLVWVHNRTAQNLAISGDYQTGTDDKTTVTRALLKPNTISDDYKVYGTPVYVKEVNGVLEITDLGGMAAVEYLYGLKARPQRSIDVSQFDYGLLRPTSPPGAKIMSSPFRPTLDSVVYDIPALLSINLIEGYATGLSVGQARAIMIEVEPTAPEFKYTAGSIFTDTTHVRAFPGFYPKNITRGRFLLGYVKLYFEIVSININDIYPAQEVYSKETIAGVAVLDTIVTQFGEIVTAFGKVVRYVGF